MEVVVEKQKVADVVSAFSFNLIVSVKTSGDLK